MNQKRCLWAENTFPQYEEYHDLEWGVPARDDRTHFEFLILESAQAGLSWSTILKRRSGYRKAFSNFDVQAVARFDDKKIEELLKNPEIIRNRAKVASAVKNARRFIEVQEEFGSFSDYIWRFVDNEIKVGHWKKMSDVPATTKESDLLSKDLKKRGFSFVGSTIVYAHMQATGLVNDHTTDCFRYKELVT